MKVMIIKARAKVWLYPGTTANWHFVSLTDETARKIANTQEGKKRIGWGSVKVRATIGKTTWETSVFPEKGSRSFVLPLKASVRKAEDISSGDTVAVTLTLL